MPGMQSYISKARIRNYKCFDDVEVELGPHINVVIGKNNAGKTALLEALAFEAKVEGAREGSVVDFMLTMDQAYFNAEVGRFDLPVPDATKRDDMPAGYGDSLVGLPSSQPWSSKPSITSTRRRWPTFARPFGFIPTRRRPQAMSSIA